MESTKQTEKKYELATVTDIANELARIADVLVSIRDEMKDGVLICQHQDSAPLKVENC